MADACGNAYSETVKCSQPQGHAGLHRRSADGRAWQNDADPLCVEPTSYGFGFRACGNPIKEDGLCGRHVGVRKRRENNDRKRREQEAASRRAREEDARIAAALSAHLGWEVRAVYPYSTTAAFMLDREAVRAWWAEQNVEGQQGEG